MKQKMMAFLILLMVLIVFLMYGFYSFAGNHITGRGSQSWGECIDADKDIEKGVPTAYCYDAKSYQVDRCVDAAVLLDWYCHQGWCENKKVNCKKRGGSCQFGKCNN